MNKLLLCILTYLCIVPTLSARVGDDGWSSSGGGEYIINQSNPWFIGTDTVKWCIDHGGEDKFSLPFNLAKIEIEAAINNLSKQLKNINDNDASLPFPTGHNGWMLRKCTIKIPELADDCQFYEGSQISDHFSYTQDCSQADLEFILGNYENKKIQTFIKSIGANKFVKMAGVAIRTEYSIDNLRGKGFIYIAADKGNYQYSGARNLDFKNTTIWNTHAKLNNKAPFPAEINTSNGDDSLTSKYNLKLKDYSLGALQPIIAHELGHTFGFNHNHSSNNIMDEDYPAKVISSGLAFKGNYLRESKIFSRALLEFENEHRIGLEWAFNRIKWDVPEDLKNESPNIYQFMFGFPGSIDFIGDDQTDNSRRNETVLFLFDLNSFDSSKHHIQQAIYKKDKLEFQIVKTFKIETDTCASPSTVETINVRFESPSQGEGLEFDESTMKWIKSNKNVEATNVKTVPMLKLGHVYFCGKIYLSKDNKKYVTFKLSHNYFYLHSTLELIDPTNPSLPFTTWFTDSDILTYSNSTQILPFSFPVFEFSK